MDFVRTIRSVRVVFSRNGKEKTMKLKDLPKDKQLIGLRIKILKKLQKEHGLPGSIMYIRSGWIKGLWLTIEPDSSRIYPFTFESFKDIENLQVS